MFLETGSVKWYYREYGKGKKILFAFHGFDRTGEDFKVFENSLGSKYTIVAIDLLYHGKSSYPKINKANILSYDNLKELISLYIQKRSIEKFGILGYSLGGRVAFACIELFPEQVEEVYLFAPDGVSRNRFYEILRSLYPVQSLYKKFIHKPGFMFKSFELLTATSIMSKRLNKFLHYQLETVERRQKIYNVWKLFRRIYPNMGKVKKIINHMRIPVYIFYGKHDPIEPIARGKKLLKGIEENSKLFITDNGHNLISEKMNTYLKSHL